MSERKATLTIKVCDFCNEDQGTYCGSCDRCGKHICFDCQKTHAVEYRHSVHCIGSGDGTYCTSCNAAMEAKPDRVFLAYQKIASLRAEAERFYKDFEVRRTLAESELEKARGKA